jgi:hypothetical protein
MFTSNSVCMRLKINFATNHYFTGLQRTSAYFKIVFEIREVALFPPWFPLTTKRRKVINDNLADGRDSLLAISSELKTLPVVVVGSIRPSTIFRQSFIQLCTAEH